jgi:glutamyl-tRNA reductase
MRKAMSAFALPSKFLTQLGQRATPVNPASVAMLVRPGTTPLSRSTVTPPSLFLTALSATSVIPGTEEEVAASAPATPDGGGSDEKVKAVRKKPSSQALDVHAMGLSIHHAAVDVREKLAIKQDCWVEAAAELVEFSDGVIQEAAVLSTCNRFELYMSSTDGRAARAKAASWLASRSGLSQKVLRSNLFMLSGEDAGWHLLRVSAGLDSLVVGEGQILAQVAACYQAATQVADPENGVKAGSGGKVLSRMLNTAVAAGKRARAETSISKGAVSISSAAVEFTKATLPKDVAMTLPEARICIVGAGTMTRLLVTHLKSQGVKKIVLVNRSVGPGSRAQELADAHDDIEWVLRTPEHMYASMAECDVAYMSTSAETPIVTAAGIEEHVVGTAGRSLLLSGGDAAAQPLSIVDISVPRNVETAVDSMAGVFSYNVDDLKAVVSRNTAMRKREMLEAEVLLREELANYQGWHQSLGAVPTIAKLQETAESFRLAEFTKNEKKLKNLSEKELDAVERLSRGIVNKLLHGPMAHLRQPESVEDKGRTLKTLSDLFGLERKPGDNNRRGGKRARA